MLQSWECGGSEARPGPAVFGQPQQGLRLVERGVGIQLSLRPLLLLPALGAEARRLSPVHVVHTSTHA